MPDLDRTAVFMSQILRHKLCWITELATLHVRPFSLFLPRLQELKLHSLLGYR